MDLLRVARPGDEKKLRKGVIIYEPHENMSRVYSSYFEDRNL